MEDLNHDHYFLVRLQRITDVVFAISMVLFIIIGTFQVSSSCYWEDFDQNSRQFILDQAFDLGTAFLVFLFLAFYWFTNASLSKYIVRVDTLFIWIQIIFLFFIAMAPLPNALSIKYGNEPYAQMFINITMLSIGSLAFFAWFYASRNNRLIQKGINRRELNKINREMAIEPLVAVLAIIATLIDVRCWTPVLLLMPLLMLLNSYYSRNMKKTLDDGLPAS